MVLHKLQPEFCDLVIGCYLNINSLKVTLEVVKEGEGCGQITGIAVVWVLIIPAMCVANFIAWIKLYLEIRRISAKYHSKNK